MVNDILTAAGVNSKRGRFPKPPPGTYAVYFDSITAARSDFGAVGFYEHDVSVELYEDQPDDLAELSIEAQLDARGLSWEKEDRLWLQDAQRYQVAYRFSFTSKDK